MLCLLVLQIKLEQHTQDAKDEGLDEVVDPRGGLVGCCVVLTCAWIQLDQYTWDAKDLAKGGTREGLDEVVDPDMRGWWLDVARCVLTCALMNIHAMLKS